MRGRGSTGRIASVGVPSSDPLETLRVLFVGRPASASRDVAAAAGSIVETVADARQALQHLARHGVDVVVVQLPGRDAESLVSEIQAVWPWVGIVKAGPEPMSPDALRSAILEQARARRDESPLQNQLALLREFSETAIAASSPDGVLHKLATGLADVVPCSVIGMLFIGEGEADSATHLVVHALQPISHAFLQELEQDMVRRLNALTGVPLKYDQFFVNRGGAALDAPHPDAGPQRLRVPLIIGNAIRGVVVFVAREPGTFDARALAFLRHASNHLSIALASLGSMHELAIRDALTGLYNLRGINDGFQQAYHLARRHGHPIGVMVLDVDHFKTVNDSYGHPAGDEVLREFAQLMRQTARATDIVGRFGGDEMMAVLPLATAANARTLGERLMANIRDYVFCPKTHALKLTASIGAVSCTPATDGQTIADLLRKADQAMYAAKRGGRNRLVLWSNYAPLAATDDASTTEAPTRIERTHGEAGRTQVLLVDDDPTFGLVMKTMLARHPYDLTVEQTGPAALRRLSQSSGLFDIMLVDLSLAGESGLDLLDQIPAADDSVVRIVFTGYATADNAIASLRRGAFDFIAKPFTYEQLVSTLERAAKYHRLLVENRKYEQHMADMVRQRSAALSEALQHVRKSYNFTLEALAALADAHEHQTAQHSMRVSRLARILAGNMGLPDRTVEEIRQGALLHDIGKIAVPDSILLKPGPLSAEEWDVMRQHPETGYRILKDNQDLSGVARIVYEHQERYDGSGYPRRLRGEEICLGARAFAVVDSYDAMRSPRVYSQIRTREVAAEEIRRLSGTRFDPEIVRIFIDSLAEIEDAGKWSDPPAAVPAG